MTGMCEWKTKPSLMTDYLDVICVAENRYICVARPEDAERIVSDHNAALDRQHSAQGEGLRGESDMFVNREDSGMANPLHQPSLPCVIGRHGECEITRKGYSADPKMEQIERERYCDCPCHGPAESPK